VSTYNLKYCYKNKEPFQRKNPTLHLLMSCFSTDNIYFMHVKPWHIKRSRHYTISIQKFIDKAFRAGVRLGLFNHRQNAVARLLSSIEISARYAKVDVYEYASTYNITNIISEFEKQYVSIQVGRAEAIKIGMNIIDLDFNEIIYDFCSVIKRIGYEMMKLNYTNIIHDDNMCKTKFTISKVERLYSNDKKLSIEERMGKEFTIKLYKQLLNTPYEWMLDLSAKQWPDEKQNPCYIYYDCIRD
jgi:hypothetical protein